MERVIVGGSRDGVAWGDRKEDWREDKIKKIKKGSR